MGIFTNKFKAQVKSIEAENKKLIGRVEAYQKVQETLARKLSTLAFETKTYVGNEYKDYATAVQAISDKYKSESDWGCLQTGSAIDLRAAFILGEGPKIVHRTETRKEAEKELAWAEEFFSYNGLDAEMAQELAKEAEIEGKIALRLFYDEEKIAEIAGGMISVRFISWLAKKYKVEADPQDYLWYKKMKWNAGADYPAADLEETDFVYKKFGGRMNDPNDAQPKVMKCLTQIDRLDKALRDLREINHLFASPTADFEVETPQQASELLQSLEDINWKIGRIIAHVGTFSLKSPDSAGVSNLVSEIELLVKMISGTTGIPIHYFGLLDLLKNRATGDNTRELVMAATTRERSIWIGAYEELLEKAMAKFNKEGGGGQKSTRLDPEKVGVEIPLISQDHWANLQNVLIPAAAAGIVSKEFVAEQIPGVDMEVEAERREEAEDKEMEQAKLDLERMRQGMLGRGDAE